MTHSVPKPHGEYTKRLSARQADAASWGRRDRRVSNLRLVVFVCGLIIAGVVYADDTLSWWWVLFPIVMFVALLMAHERVRQRSDEAGRSVAFYERGLARLEERWAGTGIEALSLYDERHPYAGDVDLFGRGSLFELLCTARTSGGVQTLADWLREPATPDEIRARHAAIDELREQPDLRETVALLGPNHPADLHSQGLVTWSQRRRDSHVRRHRLTAAGLSAATVFSVIGWAWGWFGLGPLLVALVVSGLFARRLRVSVEETLAYVRRHGQDLALLGELLTYIEHASFHSPRMTVLRAGLLDTGGATPSQQLAKLIRLLTLHDSTRNQFFAPIAVMLLWTTQVALAIEAWRAVSGTSLREWLRTVGDFEALIALSGYAYEHPIDPFPELIDEGPVFEGEALGHPLLPRHACVRNDVSLGPSVRMLMVSGSNMSGKSTLLRTVGINTVLALAGAPVCARRLRLSRLAIGATLRIEDSLQAGTSRFYAEITRIRQIMELTNGPIPVLFLLDEMLHGTNSHDRLIGSEALIRNLLARGAIGLVTTHDLALVAIAANVASQVSNVHFEDQMTNGRLAFDYRMRPGVVQHSNALALMRSVGLEVS